MTFGKIPFGQMTFDQNDFGPTLPDTRCLKKGAVVIAVIVLQLGKGILGGLKVFNTNIR
jgi:hypothetical protein